MTKKEFAKLISAEVGVNVTEVENVLDALGEVMPSVLKDGESVFMRGFGTFKSVTRKQKQARNITTGAVVVVPERVVPVLKFSKEFIEKVR